MKNLSIKNIVSACGGGYIGSDELLELEISAVSTDSRAVTENCLFAAIVGERVDGHDYIDSAFEKGALCVLSQRELSKEGKAVIVVNDVLTALQKLAAFYRSGFDMPIIGITGSVGKTTAKEMLYSVLSQKYKVHKTSGNFNNDLGVPLTVFGLNEEHEAAVIEMGISHFGDMKRLSNIVRPDYAVFTVIGYAHIEHLGSREGVLREKTSMLESMADKAKIFVNGDDELLHSFRCTQDKTCFGLSSDCHVRAQEIAAENDGSNSCIIVCGDRRIPAKIYAYGDHMVYAALEAAAVGMELGLSDEEISRGIAAYETVGSRSRIIDTGKIRIIDDCYNANPNSMASSIRSMSKLEGRKVCILGDMLELGADAEKLHRDMGELAVCCGADLVLCCGELSVNICSGAGDIALHFAELSQLIAALPEYIKNGDTVLVKASHSMGFEAVSKELEKNWG